MRPLPGRLEYTLALPIFRQEHWAHETQTTSDSASRAGSYRPRRLYDARSRAECDHGRRGRHERRETVGDDGGIGAVGDQHVGQRMEQRHKGVIMDANRPAEHVEGRQFIRAFDRWIGAGGKQRIRREDGSEATDPQPLTV